MTCNILTKGHIRLLEKLWEQEGDLMTVGLLTSKALKGYKEELVPYEERKYIMDRLFVPYLTIVPQEMLNPIANIKKYKCWAIASGDGWEPIEIEETDRHKIKRIDIQSGCKLHSSDIVKKRLDS